MNINIILHRIVSEVKAYAINKDNKRDFSIWIFGEWFGKKCSDNVCAFANYVAEHGDSQLKLFWICNEGTDTSCLHNRVKVINRRSEQSINLQKTAGVAIMNQGYDDFSDEGNNYLGNAISINLWHGVMWKKIGYDSYPDNLFTKLYINVVKRVKEYSLFVAPSNIYADYFSEAFRINKFRAIYAGYPRNELFFDQNRIDCCRKKIIEYVRSLKVNVNGDTHIITYMPTFRDETTKAFSFSSYRVTELDAFLEKNNCIIIQKSHERNIERGAGYGHGGERRVINIDSYPPQELLAGTDILVTDYSSCLFDFLLLNRPIIQFVYDYEYYSTKDRGLYYSFENVDCGNVIRDEFQLLDAIQDCVLHPDKDQTKRALIKSKFMTYECRDNSRIIYESIQKCIKEQ